MGRHKTRAQGIRKKRTSKQTLVKVAERREKKQEKIQATILARQGVRKNTLVGIASANNQRSPHDEPQTSSPFIEEDTGFQERSVARKVTQRQSVYQSLLASLKTSSEHAFSGTTRDTPSRIGNKENVEGLIPSPKTRHLEKESSEGDLREKAETNIANDVGPSVEQMTAESHAAAAREHQHFRSDIKPQNIEQESKALGNIPGLGRVSVSLPKEHLAACSELFANDFAGVDEVHLGMRPSLFKKWEMLMETEFGNRKSIRLARIHRAFIAVVREYRDIFICGKFSNLDDDLLRRLYTVHCLSHVLRGRNRVLRNDSKLAKPEDGWELEKDQGYTRPTVLILLPMKNLAYEVVKTLQALAVGADSSEGDVSQIANKDRFESEFAPDSSDNQDGDQIFTENGENTSLPGKKRQKPEDHRRTFRGNIDDDFKLGIAFTKKSMKLYNDFYASDIIIASPLGLRRLLAEKASGKDIKAKLERQKKEEAEEWKSKIGSDSAKPKVDSANCDFLSSIEVCILDSLHIFSMQNWETLEHTVSMMNEMPSSTRDTDFSRVRDWCLDGFMRNFRQTIILSEYRKSEFLSLFRKLSNHSGKVQIVQAPREHGATTDVIVGARQTFFKLPNADSPLQALKTRLDFFFDDVLPQLRSMTNSRSLIVIPSYFDYVQVRNRLVTMANDDPSIRFTSMCEYSKPNEVSRARSRLFDGSVAMVLMTERFHFYWRYWIRGVNTVVWYSLPENAIFYPELLNMTAEAAESGQSVRSMALYNIYDSFSLERVVGTTRSKKMISKRSRSMYLFL